MGSVSVTDASRLPAAVLVARSTPEALKSVTGLLKVAVKWMELSLVGLAWVLALTRLTVGAALS